MLYLRANTRDGGKTVIVRCDVFVDKPVKCVQFACVRHYGKDTSFGGQFPQRPGAHLLGSGKAPDASSNEEKIMDLGIDY